MNGPVLYVLKRYPRLSETFVVRELSSLESLGERVLIDSLLSPESGPRHPQVDTVAAEVRYLGTVADSVAAFNHAQLFVRHPIRWIRECRQARRQDLWKRFVQAGLTAQRARTVGVVHLHAHFATAAAEVATIAGRLINVPVTVTAHAKDVFHNDNAPQLQRRLRGVSGVVTVSAHNAEHLATVLDNTPVHHIPNGMDVPNVSPGPARDGVILCVARLIEKKGVDTLIRAFALVATHHPDAQVEIIGAGPLLGDLERLSVALGVDDRVTFAGPQAFPDVQDAYGRAALVVLPCRVSADGDRDGLPTVLLEAMAQAVPVISTSVAGIPELVINDENGLTVEPDDPRGLAEAIRGLLDDPERAQHLGEVGRRTVAIHHDPLRSASLLKQLFHPEVVA